MLETTEFLDIITQYGEKSQERTQAHRDTRLGTVDPAYVSGAPKVTLDGSNIMSANGYMFLPSYKPVAGDRVVMLPVGSSFVIAGSVASTPSEPVDVSPKINIVENTALYRTSELSSPTAPVDVMLNPLVVTYPGFPYHAEVMCHFEYGSTTAGTRWDLFIQYLNPSNAWETIGVDIGLESTAFRQAFGYRKNITQNTQFKAIINRIYGPNNGRITPFNAKFYVKVLPA